MTKIEEIARETQLRYHLEYNFYPMDSFILDWVTEEFRAYWRGDLGMEELVRKIGESPLGWRGFDGFLLAEDQPEEEKEL